MFIIHVITKNVSNILQASTCDVVKSSGSKLREDGIGFWENALKLCLFQLFLPFSSSSESVASQSKNSEMIKSNTFKLQKSLSTPLHRNRPGVKRVCETASCKVATIYFLSTKFQVLKSKKKQKGKV